MSLFTKASSLYSLQCIISTIIYKPVDTRDLRKTNKLKIVFLWLISQCERYILLLPLKVLKWSIKYTYTFSNCEHQWNPMKTYQISPLHLKKLNANIILNLSLVFTWTSNPFCRTLTFSRFVYTKPILRQIIEWVSWHISVKLTYAFPV